MKTPRRQYKKLFRFSFSLLVIVLFQLNLGCSTRTSDMAEDDPYAVNPYSQTDYSQDPFNQQYSDPNLPSTNQWETWANPQTTNYPIGNMIPVSTTEENCLIADPVSNPNCVDTGLVGTASSAPSEAAIQMETMFVNQALSSMKYMSNCFDQVLWMAPDDYATQAEVDMAFMQAQFGLINCYEFIYGRMIELLPWVAQQAQAMTQTKDNNFPLLMMMMSMSSGDDD